MDYDYLFFSNFWVAHHWLQPIQLIWSIAGLPPPFILLYASHPHSSSGSLLTAFTIPGMTDDMDPAAQRYLAKACMDLPYLLYYRRGIKRSMGEAISFYLSSEGWIAIGTLMMDDAGDWWQMDMSMVLNYIIKITSSASWGFMCVCLEMNVLTQPKDSPLEG